MPGNASSFSGNKFKRRIQERVAILFRYNVIGFKKIVSLAKVEGETWGLCKVPKAASNWKIKATCGHLIKW